ncbi:MAG: hypothetical protein Q8M88_09115 [Phenylobacterium sp.]|uniref:hypothetical protein n=1 Tax=Phenylobacterium sp. TaxID=1871053 RepID=UPI002734B208|nr:hypothetical protein [Phenylobacterium sp.]MDP3174577.1 hypothetical protein [Phenylobacterium sp.]
MAKAVFQRNQKVWVESVGAWSVVERIVPVWARGFEEPIRVTYDVGLGREFHAHELRAEQDDVDVLSDSGSPWRLLRARNKWQTPEDCPHHPFPGTYPVVVTDANDWGGWRVPGAEYDRAPSKLEMQARLIVSAPRLLALARHLAELVLEMPEDSPSEVRVLAEEAIKIDRYVREIPEPDAPVEEAKVA